jgi:hypothetical protein
MAGFHRRGHRILAGSLFALAAFAGDASAQTWTGLGADNNWSTGANWSGGIAPASSATTVVSFTSATPRMTPVVDVPWTVKEIDFGPAYHLTGQPITLAGALMPTILRPSLMGTVPAIIDNPIVLSVGAGISANSPIDITGGISGPGSLLVGGQLGLSGTNTIPAGTTGTGGLLTLNGAIVGPLTLDNASLSGTGTINGPVTVTGGLLLPSNLTTGNLVLSGVLGAGSLGINISGPAQGTQYGVVHVNGAVDLTGSLFGISGSYAPVPGDVFTIVDNDGTDAIVGAFTSFPEGSTFTFNGATLRISYVGGTGNDVTLTALSGGALPQVPTLSQWALIVLAMMVLAIGMRTYARRR